jgi:hypothetical protein
MEVDLPDLVVTDVLIITVNVSCDRRPHSGSQICYCLALLACAIEKFALHVNLLSSHPRRSP